MREQVHGPLRPPAVGTKTVAWGFSLQTVVPVDTIGAVNVHQPHAAPSVPRRVRPVTAPWTDHEWKLAGLTAWIEAQADYAVLISHHQDAEQAGRQARGEFVECGSRQWAARCLEVLGQSAAGAGRAEGRGRLYTQAPYLPRLLAGAMMRHHRTRAGMNLQKAGNLSEVSADRLGALEKGRLPLPVPTARTLLDAYGAPAHDMQLVLTRLAHPRHQHRIDGLNLSQTWVNALTASARTVLVYSANPLSLHTLPPAVSPSPTARSRGPSAPGRSRMVLLLDEELANHAHRGPAAGHLSNIIRQAEAGTITVHLVPGQIDASTALLAEYTCTAWGWDGSYTDRLRRQVFVTQPHDSAHGSLRNGPEAARERQMMQQAVNTAQPFQWSLHQLRQAARAAQIYLPAQHFPSSPAPATSANAGHPPQEDGVNVPATFGAA